jgi:hypothetical protein
MGRWLMAEMMDPLRMYHLEEAVVAEISTPTLTCRSYPPAIRASTCAGGRVSPIIKPATAERLALHVQSRKTARRRAMELRAAESARLERPCATVPASMSARRVPEPAPQEPMHAMASASPTTTSPAAGPHARRVQSRTMPPRRPAIAASVASFAPPVSTRAAAHARATTARPHVAQLVLPARQIPTESRPV